jgi:hypothetical protein
MKLLTPLLLTIALCARAARAQDSPIYLNDNGGVPLDSEGGKGKGPKKRPPSSDNAPWSYNETHIHYDKSIQHNNGEYSIDDTGYRAVCLDTSDGHHIDIPPNTKWSLKSLSHQDSATIGSKKGNSHVHIKPGKTMWYNSPNDMDDPDPADIPHGTKNQLTGAKFNGMPYPHVPGKSYIIHYCGPDPGCLGGVDGQTEQCPHPINRK